MTEAFDLCDKNNERTEGILSWFQKKIKSTKVKSNEFVDDLKKAQSDLDIAMNNYDLIIHLIQQTDFHVIKSGREINVYLMRIH